MYCLSSQKEIEKKSFLVYFFGLVWVVKGSNVIFFDSYYILFLGFVFLPLNLRFHNHT